MDLLLPDKAIAALEDYVITPNLGLHPTLGVVIRTGESSDPDHIYLRSIQKKADKYGAKVEVAEVDNYTEAAAAIQSFRHNYRINGIIILAHFTPEIDTALANMIPTRLDIDCVASNTYGLMFTSNSPVSYRLGPCAPVAVMKMLEYEGLSDLSGLNVAVIGRSLRVGRPLAEILTQHNATVTCYHSHSLPGIEIDFDSYDIIISAVGKPKIWSNKENWGTNQYLIDIGINTDENGKICGDFDFESYVDATVFITPVPGGIGQLATVVLFAKLFTAAAQARGELTDV